MMSCAGEWQRCQSGHSIRQRILKILRPDLKVSYVHHIPWLHESLENCHHCKQILNSLSYCDHIYMHIPSYLNAFLASLGQFFTCSVSICEDADPQFNTDSSPLCCTTYPRVIECESRSIELHAHPMPFNSLAIDPILPSLLCRDKKHSERTCFLVISRMDYSKGIKEFLDNLHYLFIARGYLPTSPVFFDLNFILFNNGFRYLIPIEFFLERLIFFVDKCISAIIFPIS